MNIGERLLKYRKTKGLSQEEVAEKLQVSRQTISKWETNQSLPETEKIVPLCELFNISSDELLSGKVINSEKIIYDNPVKRALVVSLSVFLYFISLIWIILGQEVLNLNEGILVSGFLIVCAIATCLLIFYFISTDKKEIKEIKKKNKKESLIISFVTVLAVIVYLVVSFVTQAWHLTWIIWLIYITILSLIKLLFDWKEGKNEKE